MRLSTHYYVLSLSEHKSRLYEAFRDSLIDIQNTWFPFDSSLGPLQPALSDGQLHTLFRTVDAHFTHYYDHEPLGLVITGTTRHQDAFAALTAHPGVIIGKADGGDHSETSTIALGNISWPLVKRAMANAGQRVERELEEASRALNVAAGIDAVRASVDAGVGAALLVEDAYQVRPPESSSLLDDCDNLVDVIVDKVLALGGNVMFVEDGSLAKFQRIALILRA